MIDLYFIFYAKTLRPCCKSLFVNCDAECLPHQKSFQAIYTLYRLNREIKELTRQATLILNTTVICDILPSNTSIYFVLFVEELGNLGG